MNSQYSNRISSKSGVRPLSTVVKTLELLNLFADKTSPMRLAEVADAFGLSRATAYQRLFTLVSAGWLEQDEDGRYRVSMLATRLAAAALEQADFGARSNTALARLAHSVNETASLAVLDRGLPRIIARVESDSLLRAELKIGTAVSLHGSASGRVLVAYADSPTLERLRKESEPLPSEEILEVVKREGFAVSSGETEVGVKAIAAPVFDLNDRCRAAVSLVMPEGRFDLQLMKEPLIAAANEISQILHGGNGRHE